MQHPHIIMSITFINWILINTFSLFIIHPPHHHQNYNDTHQLTTGLVVNLIDWLIRIECCCYFDFWHRNIITPNTFEFLRRRRSKIDVTSLKFLISNLQLQGFSTGKIFFSGKDHYILTVGLAKISFIFRASCKITKN